MSSKYLFNNLAHVGECEVYTIPGLAASFDACWISGLRVSRIEFEEFRLLETSQFADDLQDVFVYDRVPFFCVFSSYDTDNDQSPRRSAQRGVLVRRLARSLWLLKEGEVGNPLEFIRYQRVGVMNHRDPSVYGRLGYTIEKAYVLSEAEIPIVDGIFRALTFFDEARVCRGLEIAEELFCKTYSPAASVPTDSLLLLLGSIEALAGRHLPLLADAAWITEAHRALLRDFSSLRNGVAHGGTAATRVQVSLCREIVRFLLREAILRCVRDLDEPATGKSLVQSLLALPDAGPERLAGAQVQYRGLMGHEA